jgi:hypothetical protein
VFGGASACEVVISARHEITIGPRIGCGLGCEFSWEPLIGTVQGVLVYARGGSWFDRLVFELRG